MVDFLASALGLACDFVLAWLLKRTWITWALFAVIAIVAGYFAVGAWGAGNPVAAGLFAVGAIIVGVGAAALPLRARGGTANRP